MSFGRGFDDVLSLRDAMNRLFAESFVQPTRAQQQAGGENTQAVPVNIFEAGDNVVVFVPMPGLQPTDVDISVSESVLTLRGNKRGHEERHHFLQHEWTVGPYQRSVQLPEDVDVESARASMDNGVLVITFNKSERNRPRRIQVQSGS
ncbi:MAG: Hsp20/alpha crystallin family protein [Chloroflexota bacterium]|nr:Hsp20/alpha crystallin family protein [Chloroflexota bacterium]